MIACFRTSRRATRTSGDVVIPQGIRYVCSMNEAKPPILPRSPMLMSRDDSAFLIVDIQEKLVGLIDNYERLIWNTRRIADAANIYGIPVFATEQYPKALGPTIQPLVDRIQTVAEKTRFSCGGCPELFESLPSRGIQKILVAGVESHVCVMQTTLDLLTAGFDVFVCVDAIAARFPVDHRIAIRRMEANGVTLTTTETAIFEWCETAGTGDFKQITALIRESPPESDSQR